MISCIHAFVNKEKKTYIIYKKVIWIHKTDECHCIQLVSPFESFVHYPEVVVGKADSFVDPASCYLPLH